MTGSTEIQIVFTVGRYNAAATDWLPAGNAPSATIGERLFWSIFDAVGEETIDVIGDIDPAVLLGLVVLGPHGREDTTASMRLVCQWAHRRCLRVGFAVAE